MHCDLEFHTFHSIYFSQLVPWTPPDIEQGVELELDLLHADGGQGLKEVL